MRGIGCAAIIGRKEKEKVPVWVAGRKDTNEKKDAIDNATAPFVHTTTEVAGRLPGKGQHSKSGAWAPDIQQSNTTREPVGRQERKERFNERADLAV